MNAVQSLRSGCLAAALLSSACSRSNNLLIRGDELVVNGQSYGRIKPTDSVLVDHSVVSVNKAD